MARHRRVLPLAVFAMNVASVSAATCTPGTQVGAYPPSSQNPAMATVQSVNAVDQQITVQWQDGSTDTIPIGRAFDAATFSPGNEDSCTTGGGAPTSSSTPAPTASPSSSSGMGGGGALPNESSPAPTASPSDSETCPNGAKVTIYDGNGCGTTPMLEFFLGAGAGIAGRSNSVAACAKWLPGSAACNVGDSVYAVYAGTNGLQAATIDATSVSGTIRVVWASGATDNRIVTSDQVMKGGRTCAEASATKTETGLLSSECSDYNQVLLRWCVPSKGPCDIVASTFRISKTNETGSIKFAEGTCVPGTMPNARAVSYQLNGNLVLGECTQPAPAEEEEEAAEPPVDKRWETFGKIILFVASGLFLLIVGILQVVAMMWKDQKD